VCTKNIYTQAVVIFKITDLEGATENAGLEIDGQKLQGWKMTDTLLKDS